MRRVSALLFAALLLAGCGGSKADSRVQKAGTVQAQFAPVPDPPHVGHDSGFTVTLTDNGQPVTGAKVHIQLLFKSFNQTGPSADMTEPAPGLYQGQELSTGMAGLWEADVTV